ncbi:MAG: hypothetical protein NTX59_08400 [Elusimicrobia bacterium]|nr:hypothetical protein [Elusimicrobiota bacterium]
MTFQKITHKKGKTYLFLGELHHAPNKDAVLRRLKWSVSPQNLKLVRKIKRTAQGENK